MGRGSNSGPCGYGHNFGGIAFPHFARGCLPLERADRASFSTSRVRNVCGVSGTGSLATKVGTASPHYCLFRLYSSACRVSEVF
eukprot:5199107-Amphidinium_carterae.1